MRHVSVQDGFFRLTRTFGGNETFKGPDDEVGGNVFLRNITGMHYVMFERMKPLCNSNHMRRGETSIHIQAIYMKCVVWNIPLIERPSISHI
jgi:hypothetical protein